MKMREMPVAERPREKALRYGIGTLSNEELLALLIGSGTTECSAQEIAHRIIADSGGLYNAFHLDYHEFLHYRGIGKTNAVKLSACFELANRYERLRVDKGGLKITTRSLYEKYAPEMAGLAQETLVVVVLDRKKNVIYETTLYKGTATGIPCLSSDLVRILSVYNGRYFYLIHNHPSGSLEPSRDDFDFTYSLANDLRRMNFILLDHLIISSSGYYSFMEHFRQVKEDDRSEDKKTN